MATWDIFREMENLRREIDDAFKYFGLDRSWPAAFLPGIGTGSFPRMNLSEDGNNFYVEALVPGIDPKDLEVNLMQGTLTLSGERRVSEIGDCSWHRRERGAGKFLRTIELPAPVDEEKIEAEYRNGVLMITLPKTESVKAKKIPVKVN